MNQVASEVRTIAILADKVTGISAACVNCNKRFTSMRAVSMHLRVTVDHAVIFSNHGNYDKKSGLRTLGPITHSNHIEC